MADIVVRAQNDSILFYVFLFALRLLIGRPGVVIIIMIGCGSRAHTPRVCECLFACRLTILCEYTSIYASDMRVYPPLRAAIDGRTPGIFIIVIDIPRAPYTYIGVYMMLHFTPCPPLQLHLFARHAPRSLA